MVAQDAVEPGELLGSPASLLALIDEFLLSLHGRSLIAMADVEDMLLDLRLTADRLEAEPW